MTILFQEEERHLLEKCNLAIFKDKIIYNAQPPIDDSIIEKIELSCAGPIPQELIELWQKSFGGNLDYNLLVHFDKHQQSASFNELFYPNSDGYMDLWGWLERQKELEEAEALKAGKPWSGKVDLLPFGGFEYLERLYVCVRPGKDYGSVFMWAQGLPPAWRFNLNRDSITFVSKNITSLFEMLHLTEDPTTSEDSDIQGLELYEQFDHLDNFGTIGQRAKTKLIDLMQSSVIDWRKAIENESIASSEYLTKIALKDAILSDDLTLLKKIEQLGCSMNLPICGNGTALDLALYCKSENAIEHLMKRADLPMQNTIKNSSSWASTNLIEKFLKQGAEVDEYALYDSVRAGNFDSAYILANSLIKDFASGIELITNVDNMAIRDDASAARIESGKMGSNITPNELKQQASNFRHISKYMKSIISSL